MLSLFLLRAEIGGGAGADKLIVARTEERPARPAALLSGSVYITVFLSIPDPTC